MKEYIYDTSVLSAMLEGDNPRCMKTIQAINSLPINSGHYVSTITLAELSFGKFLGHELSASKMQQLDQILENSSDYSILEVGRNTSLAYGQLKANIAKKYLPKDVAQKFKRSRWLEDWVDKFSGKTLHVDENDLWLCAQAKERSMTLLTLDKKMKRIADADEQVLLEIIDPFKS